MFSASRNNVSNSSVVGNDVNSTGRTRYSETIMTVIDISRSVTISRSSTKPGSGVISAITIPSTASGTANWRNSSSAGARPQPGDPAAAGNPAGAAMVFAGVMSLAGEPPVHEFEDVRQNLRHRAVQMRRDLLPHFHRLVQRLRQRRILDDRYLVFHGLLPDPQRQIVLALGHHHRRRGSGRRPWNTRCRS